MEFRLAIESDDEAILKLLRQIPLDGMLRIRYHREPSYFKSLDIQGIPNQTVVGSVDGNVMAVASRNLQKVYIHGTEQNVAYISNLRYHPEVRHGISLIKGIYYFEEISGQFPVDFHYATLIEKDAKTQRILASNRNRMPKFYDSGKITTYAIPLRKNVIVPKPSKTIQIIRGDEQIWPEILNFLNQEGRSRNFFPVLDENLYFSKLFKASNFFVAMEKGKVEGVCSVVDLHQYKQYVLEDYSTGFSLLRIPYNWYLSLQNRHPIPSKNSQIKFATLGFPIVKDNRSEIFGSLVQHVYSSFSGKGYHYLGLALHERDPINKALQHLPSIKYSSRLYFVKLKNDKFVLDDLNCGNNIPYIDLPRY